MIRSAASPDVCFIWPPAYYPWSCATGIAYLAAYAERAGLRVETIDANADAIEHVLMGAAPGSMIASALVVLRDPAALRDWRRYESAMELVGRTAQFAGQPDGESLRIERNTLRYRPAFELRSRAGLLAASAEPHRNLFYGYFRNKLIPRIRAMRPRFVAVSASDLHQLLPATVFAAIIRRELGSECPRLLFGGNVFTRLADPLSRSDPEARELLALWGTAVIGEGERTIVDLVKGGREDVEGRILPGRVVERRSAPIDLAQLPSPRLKGLRPWSPSPAIPLNVYRGCWYSGICTFCDINYGYDSVANSAAGRLTSRTRRRRSTEAIVEDICSIGKSSNSSIINFTDEWFRAVDMLELADQLVARRVRISWDAYARFEPLLADRQVAARIAKGGARFLQFGLETASPTGLGRIRKGIQPRVAARVLEATAAAGIWNHVFVIVGLPGETLHDTLTTVGFLIANARNIFTMKPTCFRLSRHAPIARDPATSPVDLNKARLGALDLALDLPFEYKTRSFCVRCRTEVGLFADDGMCPRCKDALVKRPVISHRIANAARTVLDAFAATHWAYPFSSLFPYHVRLHFSPEEARSIAEERGSTTDPLGGRKREEIARALSIFSRQLQWEAQFLPDVIEVYTARRLPMPRVLHGLADFVALARTWSDSTGRIDTIPPKREQRGLPVLIA